MPEPVSTTIAICWLGYTGAQGIARRSSAVSSESQVVQNAITEVFDWTERSQALFGSKAAALSSLRAIAAESTGLPLDDDILPANPAAVLQAENFIRVLPDGMPLPEFALEPDGSISLDWLEGRSRTFSLSIGSSDRLAFAWLDGSDKGHGVARFDGQAVPPRVLSGIQSITGHASLRPA